MATIAEATFKAIHDVAKLEVGSGDGKFEIKMLPPTKDMYDDMVTLGGIVENAGPFIPLIFHVSLLNGSISQNSIE